MGATPCGFHCCLLLGKLRAVARRNTVKTRVSKMKVKLNSRVLSSSVSGTGSPCWSSEPAYLPFYSAEKTPH